MENMLLLRPPPRSLLEGGPPKSVKAALERFDKKGLEQRRSGGAFAHIDGATLATPLIRSAQRLEDLF